jgi:O-antigen/teichoic acid export membrane protein
VVSVPNVLRHESRLLASKPKQGKNRGRTMSQPQGDSPTPPPLNRVVLLAKNAGHNLVRALSSSLVSVLLPLVLLALLPHQIYAAWALVFSLAAYVLYLDLGVPTSVQAIVGRSDGSTDQRGAISAAASGLKVVSALIVVCLIVAGIGAMSLDVLFPSMSKWILSQAGWALVIITVGALSNLLANTGAAYFAGQQRSHIPTAVIAPSRVISMAAAVSTSAITDNLVPIAIGYTVPLLVGAAVLLLRFADESRRVVDRSAKSVLETPVGIRYLLGYSGPLILWNLSMLLVTGIGLAIVARVDYSAVVAYSFATILVAAITGVDSAFMAPVLPELGRSYSLNGMRRVAELVTKISALNSAFVVTAVAGLILLAPVLVTLLAPTASENLPQTLAIIVLLLSSVAVRLSMSPMSLAFIATKKHHKVIAPPLIEALSTAVLSVAFGSQFGAIGVALGAFAGAVVGVVLTLTWSLHLASFDDVSSRQLCVGAVFRPAVVLLSAVLCAFIALQAGAPGTLSGWLTLLVGAVVTLILVWFVGLSAEARKEVSGQVNRFINKRKRTTVGD